MRRSAWDAFVLTGKLSADLALKYYLYQIYPYATTWLYIVPYMTTTIALMFGNFSQHIFVDPEKFTENTHLTYNCIGPGSLNEKIFNDGYHIVHHENGKMPWYKQASHFGDNWEEYDKAGALCFKGIDFIGVGVLVLTGQLDKLAQDHYVGTDPDVVETMKRRLRPITASVPQF
jgi:fatty acid desaturase